MASSGSLLVRPGTPDTPEFVDIDSAGLDTDRTVELLVNGTVVATVPVDLSGKAIHSYVVPTGTVRNALVDINFVDGRQEVISVKGGQTISRLETGLGDSIELRYQAV